MNEEQPIMIRCKHCEGIGERDHVFFVTHPAEYSGGDAYVEPVECLVCKGTGKVALHED
tara:strand:- start:2170 stop:2346 length:177 start_codon:yes stop_codon:yes gene_type:complete